MNSREFGRSGIDLSPVTFGSMRLDQQKIDLAAAVNLITYLYESGVNTFHSSHEYETDSFFCRVMQQFQAEYPGAEVVHIAKIGVPHFDESKFNSAKLVSLIEQRLKQLNTERIDLVQWLVRHQPNDDQHRLPILAECQAELADTWFKLQQAGKVGALASFPYSVAFAQAVLDFPTCQGLVTYLNLLELEMVSFLDSMSQNGQGYVAIRPLGGGLITSDNFTTQSLVEDTTKYNQLESMRSELNMPTSEITKFAVQFPLLHPAVASVMVSITSIDHATEVIEAAEVASDRQHFAEIVKVADSAISSKF